MKKAPEKDNEMLREYDFSQGIRGKYARRYAKGSNVVVLESDAAKVFPIEPNCSHHYTARLRSQFP